MAKKAVKVGDIVHIVFLDHAENSRDSLKFEVFGRVFGVTSTAYLIYSWAYVNPVDLAGDNNSDVNQHSFAIVKSAVESVRVLK